MGALATLGTLLSGCDESVGVGDKHAVGKDALQTDIASRLAEAGEKPQSVTCKEDLIGEVGKTARCEVVMSPTNSFQPVITVTGADENSIDYEMSPALSKEQLEKAVSRLTAATSVSCESGLEGRTGATAHCDVDTGGLTLRRTIEVSNVEGLMMNFDLVPVLTKDEVATSLLDEFERQLGRRPDSAQCTGNLEGKTGHTVDCTVVTGSVSESLRLTVTTVNGGSIKYSYAPRP